MNENPQIKFLSVGPLQANCYLLADPAGQVAIIDPGGDPEEIFSVIDQEGWSPVVIINTHNHIDHVAANRAVVDRYQVPLLIHRRDAAGLSDPGVNLSNLGFGSLDSPRADRELDHGDEIRVGRLVLKVIATPGHTPGSISLLLERSGKPAMIFTGDTLFAGGVGRTDFPGGSGKDLVSSIRDRLLVFPDPTVILPGHGDSSTIGEQRRGNYFVEQFVL